MEDRGGPTEHRHIIATRRTHTKSRGGCNECKRRKIKEKPECAGCRKRLLPCEYLPLESTQSPSTPRQEVVSEWILPTRPSSAGGGTATNARISLTNLPLPSQRSAGYRSGGVQFDMEDMALWHQFITETAATISKPWEKELPRLALTCDYMMYGILGAAALHLAYLLPEQREKYDLLSARYLQAALGPFKKAITEITPENCNHVFAFATLLTVYYYASFRSPEYLQPISGTAPYQGYSSWIMCIRGCATVFYQARQHIKAGPLGYLASSETIATVQGASNREFPPDENDNSLAFVIDHLLTSPATKLSTTVEEMEAYVDAISRLRKLLVGASHGTELFLRRYMCTLWSYLVSDTFLRLLSEQRPVALIIMAHYCLLMKKCEDCWYVSDRANHIFDAIRYDLDEEWHLYIQHPLRVFECSPRDTSSSSPSPPNDGQDNTLTPDSSV